MFVKLIKLKPRAWIVASMAAVFVLMCVFLFQFIDSVEDYQIISNDKRLAEIARRNAISVKSSLNNYFEMMNTVSVLYENFEDFKSPEALKFLDNIAKSGGYDRFAVDFYDGSSYMSDGPVINSDNYGYRERVMRGDTFISDVVLSVFNNYTVNLFVPLHRDSFPVASLRLEISTEKLTKAFNIGMFEDDGYFHLIDQYGLYVVETLSPNALLMRENFFTAIDKLSYESGYSAAQIKDDFANGRAGLTKYYFGTESRHAYYEPVGINNWMMMTMVPKSVVMERINENIRLAFSLLVKMLVMLLILSGSLIYTQRRGRIKADLNERCYKLLAEQTGKVIFEWDFEGNKITTLSNFEKIFGRTAITTRSEDDAINLKLVHPEDAEAFKGIFVDIRSGKNVDAVKFRVKDFFGAFHWCSLSGVIIRNDVGKPFKALGTLENIDHQVRVEEVLRLKASTDSLTGFYNKNTAELLITESIVSISSKTKNALICADLDNFKNINDSFGHLFGDRVLQEVASDIKGLFRSTDIIGRFGGDEFLIFVRDVQDAAFLEKKAVEMNNKINKTYTVGEISHTISISIGIAVYPENGNTYVELYKQADGASYEAKRSGKNTFRFAK